MKTANILGIVGAVLVVMSLLLVGTAYAAVGAQVNVKTDKKIYDLGETITVTCRNTGNSPVYVKVISNGHTAQHVYKVVGSPDYEGVAGDQPDLGLYLYDPLLTYPCYDMSVMVQSGDIWSWTWDQEFYGGSTGGSIDPITGGATIEDGEISEIDPILEPIFTPTQVAEEGVYYVSMSIHYGDWNSEIVYSNTFNIGVQAPGQAVVPELPEQAQAKNPVL